jgi:hypothetical protein
VLSLSASARWRDDYRIDGQRWQPGLSWTLSPQVNFAVNHRVTLLGALSFSQREPLRIDGQAQSQARRELGFRAGLGFTPAAGHTLFMTGDYSQAASAGMTLQWLYEL